MLYIRMILYMVVSLYTSRVVLQTLGVEDFGIYNLVGGIISMLGFLNSSLVGSTSRFITFALGSGNFENLKRTFAASFNLHLALAILVVLIGETIGLWFLQTQLIIPENRMEAAQWIFQASIFSSSLTIAQMPYGSTLIAHERMKIYAYIGILEICLKLGIVYLLLISPFDKLITYSFLLTGVSTTITFIYIYYCRKHYKECQPFFFWDKKIYKEILSFSGWTLYSTLSWMAKGDGLNMLLNIFFGPAVNAARGIAFQVNNAVKSFVTNFTKAFNPQITKLYASHQYNQLYPFISQCTKLSFLLLFALTLPLLMETGYILSLWLGEVPSYTIIFTKLVLTESLIDVMAISMSIGIYASGKVKYYHIANGSINILSLPLSYLLLKIGYDAYSVFIITICLTFIIFVVTMYYSRRNFAFPVKTFLKEVVSRISIIALLSSTILFFTIKNINPGFKRFVITCIVSILINSLLYYLIGLNKNEKEFIHQLLKKPLTRTRQD